VLVEFILSDSEADALLTALREENVHLFYARLEAEFEVIEPRADLMARTHS